MPPLPIVVVIRFSSLGDCLLLGPVFRGLRNRFPNHRIMWVTKAENAPIWHSSNLLDVIIAWKKHEDLPIDRVDSYGHVEYVLDLQASRRSRQLARGIPAPNKAEAAPPRWQRTLQILFKGHWLDNEPPVPLRYLRAAESWGVVDDSRGLEIPVLSENKTERLLPIDREYIGLAPGSKHYTKQWQLDRWLELARLLSMKGYGIFWILGPEEAEARKRIQQERAGSDADFIPKKLLSIDELISEISHCRAIVSNDSAAMHIAAGTNRPGIALFGPTIPAFGFAPFRSRIIVMERNLWCRPCSAHGGKFCPLGHHRCMKEISVEMVYNQLSTMLQEP